jgi:hypothetical protein
LRVATVLAVAPLLLASPPASQIVPLRSAAATCWRAVGASLTTCQRPAAAAGGAVATAPAPAAPGLVAGSSPRSIANSAIAKPTAAQASAVTAGRSHVFDRAGDEAGGCDAGGGGGGGEISGLSKCSGTSCDGPTSCWRPRNSDIEATVSGAG